MNIVLGFRKYTFIKVSVRHRQNVVFCTKNLISNIYDAWVFLKHSEGFQENTIGGVSFVQEPEILLKERLYHRCFLFWDIFENGWPLTAPSFLKSLVWLFNWWFLFSFLPWQFLSAVSFYNATLMLKKVSANGPVVTHSLQNKHVREFLGGSYSDHFQWFTQAKRTTGFQSWLTAKIVY